MTLAIETNDMPEAMLIQLQNEIIRFNNRTRGFAILGHRETCIYRTENDIRGWAPRPFGPEEIYNCLKQCFDTMDLLCVGIKVSVFVPFLRMVETQYGCEKY